MPSHHRAPRRGASQLTLVLAASLVVTALDQATAQASAPADAPAFTVDSDALGFRVDFPAAPDFKLAEGSGNYAAKTRHGLFILAVGTYPASRESAFVPSPLTLYLATIKGALDGMEVISAAPTLVGGKLGFELVARRGETQKTLALVASGLRLYVLMTDQASPGDAAAVAELARFRRSFTLTASAPPDIAPTWRRVRRSDYAIELPSAGETQVSYEGLESLLPWPAAECSILRLPIGERAKDSGAAATSAETFATELLAKFFVPGTAPAKASAATVGGTPVPGWSMAGNFLPRFGHGQGLVRAAFVAGQGEFFLLVGRTWPGGEAQVQRCWDSFRAEVTTPSP